jgi:sulfatase maturation enzyme AslB (radical SAM superfamily)
VTRAGGGAAPSRVRALDLVLTAACNLRCSYCYQTDKRARSMEWATAQAALDLLLRSERDDLLVLFIGGEPLLEMPLIRQAIEYVRAVRPEGKNVEYAMSTNGLLLDGETVAFLAENRIHTQLSFDGVPAAQEWRGPGTHALLDGLLDRVREQFPQYLRRTFTVTITVHSGNLAYLADSVEYLMRKGVWNIGLNTLLTHDPGWTREHLAALDRQFARIFAASLAHRDETGRIPFQPLRRTREKSVHSPRGGSCAGPVRERPSPSMSTVRSPAA